MSFANKVALVTGASSGIGAAVAFKFATEGAKVALVGRNQAKLKIVSDKCSQTGLVPLTIVADVSKNDSPTKIVNDTLTHFGALDVLVNNAGIGNTTGILSNNAIDIFDQVMATNVRSIVGLINLAGPHLVKSKGNIINISSIAGLAPFKPTGFAYNTSKAALDHLTRSAAVELGFQGVRVNGINPGPVDTDILANSGLNEEQAAKMFEGFRRTTLLNRVSDPEEVADLVLFLASVKAKGITGGTYVIDNGALHRR